MAERRGASCLVPAEVLQQQQQQNLQEGENNSRVFDPTLTCQNVCFWRGFSEWNVVL